MKKTKLVPGDLPQNTLCTFLPSRKIHQDCSPSSGSFEHPDVAMDRQQACADLEPVIPERAAQAMAPAGKSTAVLPLAPKENCMAHGSTAWPVRPGECVEAPQQCLKMMT